MPKIVKGYTIKLSKVNNDEILSKNAFNLILTMQNIVEKIIQNDTDFVLELIEKGYKSGNFRDKLAKHVKFDIDKEIPNLTGSKNRYWRIISAHIYQIFSSRYERIATTRTIVENNHKTINKKLYDDLHNKNLYPTRETIKNIFQEMNKNNNKIYDVPLISLDYSYAGDGIVKPVEYNNRNVLFKVQVGSKDWVDLKILLPDTIDLSCVDRVSKPVVFVGKDGELWLRYSVFLSVFDNVHNKDMVLGVDLGRIKPITCASLSNDGVFSGELTFSNELGKLSEKIDRLIVNKNSLFDKRILLERLLVGNDSVVLMEKFDVIDKEYRFVRNKLSKLREHLAWLCARDVVGHALGEDCSVIKFEHLSWVGSSGGKWNFSDVQKRTEVVASHENIKVEYVDAHGTSWELPREYDVNPAPRSDYDSKTRELFDVGLRVDKDFSAAVAVAARIGRKKAYKIKKSSRLRVVQPKRCRDKVGITPKRPKRFVGGGRRLV